MTLISQSLRHQQFSKQKEACSEFIVITTKESFFLKERESERLLNDEFG